MSYFVKLRKTWPDSVEALKPMASSSVKILEVITRSPSLQNSSILDVSTNICS